MDKGKKWHINGIFGDGSLPESEGGANAQSKRIVVNNSLKVVNRFGKADARYWLQKVRKQLQDGKPIGNYTVRMQCGGERHLVILKSTNAKDAANEAKKIWQRLTVGGWEAIQEEVGVFAAGTKRGRRTSSSSPEESRIDVAATEALPKGQGSGTTDGHSDLTVLKLLELHEDEMGNVQAQSRKAYQMAFRAIVGDLLVMGLLAAPGTHGKITKRRNAEGREAILATPVANITREMIDLWRRDALRDATTKKKRTLRTRIVNAKQVFCPKMLGALKDRMGIEIDNPFLGVELPSSVKPRYESKVDIGILCQRAATELRDSANAGMKIVWRVFLLAASAGLRRKEIDNLRWRDINLKEGRIDVKAHEEYTPKSADSNRSVPIDPAVCEEIRQWERPKNDVYVIPPQPGLRKKDHERATGHFESLAAWLRELEIDGEKPLATVQKPIHELRKEAGSLVNSIGGIQQARVFLGHSDIATTANFYLDSTVTTTTGLGNMLRAPAERAKPARSFTPTALLKR